MKLTQLHKVSEAAEKNEIQFEDKDPEKALPELIISKIERQIKEGAKNYKVEWKNSVELVNWALKELNITKPLINTERWDQYKELVAFSVKEMNKARNYINESEICK
jgi:hypothetical protein